MSAGLMCISIIRICNFVICSNMYKWGINLIFLLLILYIGNCETGKMYYRYFRLTEE